jgi:hypothetical protein
MRHPIQIEETWILSRADSIAMDSNCQVVCCFQMNQIRKEESLFVDRRNNVRIVLTLSCPVDQRQNLVVLSMPCESAATRCRKILEAKWNGRKFE